MLFQTRRRSKGYICASTVLHSLTTAFVVSLLKPSLSLSLPLDLTGSLVTDIMMATDAVVAGEDVVDCLGIDPFAIKTIKKPGLYKRRASRNPNLEPLPKIKMPSPRPTILPGVATIITDGAAECVQAMYSKTAHDYHVAPGNDFYYTRGDLPGMLVNGTVCEGRFGQLKLYVQASQDDLIQFFLKTSTPLRRAVRSPHINRIRSNIFPAMYQGKSVTALYLKPTKGVPNFPMNEECQLYLHPSTISFNREKCEFKAWLLAIPLMFVDSRLCERDHDTVQDLPEAELTRLVIAFLKKWSTADNVTADIAFDTTVAAAASLPDTLPDNSLDLNLLNA